MFPTLVHGGGPTRRGRLHLFLPARGRIVSRARMATHHIVTLPGDGIGPEILAAATRVLDAVGTFAYEEHAFGGASIDAHGIAADRRDARPRAARPTPSCSPPSAGRSGTRRTPTRRGPSRACWGIRKALGLYANLRPVRPLPALYDASPLKRELIEGTDLLVVRELTGGIYFGAKSRTATYALATSASTPSPEIERIARIAFARRTHARDVDRQDERARDGRDCGARSSRACTREEFPNVELEHQLVDAPR